MSQKADTIRIAGLIRESIVDGPGMRFVIFAQGCPHRCQGCHNEHTHDFEGGKEQDIGEIMEDIIKNPLLSGVTFSGGEPFAQPEGFYQLGVKIKEQKLNLVVYSGYTYEELLDMGKTRQSVKGLLDISDYLIDGRFVLNQRDLTLRFRGSTNQRFIDLNATRAEGAPVLWEKA